ncbi:hypothetical protein ACTSKR_11420 [Chitinibacteraceae bacterium HSL-7]
MSFALKALHYIEQHLDALPEHQDQQPSNTIWNLEYWEAPNPDGGYLQFVRLKTADTSVNAPYHCTVLAFGLVTQGEDAEHNTPETNKAQQLSLLGQIVGAAREKVRTLSSDAPWGPIIVPTLMIK